ncbi:DUF397 domain-containing protein [Amycolatopsis sp. NPDC059021]|uniref:DUF397 domain-containing protein n=1 Tax=Amycolatopsis sp. NPDC059021 TaxID=3346704 RepID=UPI003671E81A
MVARKLTWSKSSHSGSESTSECVEVALTPQFTAVRDSKAPTGNLTLSHHAWAAFLTALSAAER